MVAHIENYYLRQAGGGGQFYAGAPYQKGYGLGGILGGLFRTLFPFLSSGASAIGREALRAGSHVLADVASGALPLSASLKRHASEAGGNLVTKLSNKMQGSGIKRPRLAAKRQLKPSLRRAHIARKTKRALLRDIFSK